MPIRAGEQSLWRSQHGFDFVAGQRFWQDFPLAGGFDIQRGVVVDFFVEQKVAVEMAEGGELAAHAAAIDLMRKKLLEEFANVVAASGEEQAPGFLQELGELKDVGGVGGDGERGQAFLDAEVVEETGEHTRVGDRGHGGRFSMTRIGDGGK